MSFCVSDSTSAPLFCLSKYVSVLQAHLQLSVFQTPWRRRRRGPFAEAGRGCAMPVAVLQLPRVPTSHGGAGVCYWTWSHCLSSLWVEVLLQPVLDCVVFSLATPMPRCNGQKCLDLCSWWLALGWSLWFLPWHEQPMHGVLLRDITPNDPSQNECFLEHHSEIISLDNWNYEHQRGLVAFDIY